MMSAFTLVMMIASLLPVLVWAWFIWDSWKNPGKFTGWLRGNTTNNFYINSHNTQVNTDDVRSIR